MKEVEELLEINPRDYDNVVLPEEEILKWFAIAEAGWVHSGDLKDPHAELTSGLCSTAFFDCLRLLKYPNIAEILGRQLGKRLKEADIGKVDWVVSPAYAAITFGHEVAKELGAIFMNVEKDPSDPKQKRMLWRRMTIPAEAKVLSVEELITTSSTFKEVQRAVIEGNTETVNFIPTVGVLVHRPPDLELIDYKAIAVMEKEVPAYDPNECPLCKAGSKRYRPKTHWKQLTGKA